MTALFDAPSQISLQRQLAAAERELRRRRQVYPNRVAAKRMSQNKAAEEIAVMEAIVSTLRRLVDQERERP